MLKPRIAHALVALVVLVAAAASATPGTAAEPLRIGMVADTNGVFDRSFNQLAYAGVRSAALRLGARIDVRASPTALSYEPNLRFMAQQGYDLIIAIGPAEAQALAAVARDYPAVRFAIVGDSYAAAPLGRLPNVLGLVFKQQEAGYLAGYLAGLVELTRLPRLKAGNVISSIDGAGDRSAARYLAGLEAGARAANPRVRLLRGSITSATPGRCHGLAAAQIAAGADIVFAVGGACNAGALRAVGERGVWALGVDADESYLGPAVLASAALRVDRAVVLTIDAVHDGRFAGGRDVEFGIAQDAIALAGINPVVPPAIRQRLNTIAKRMRAGRISIPTTPGEYDLTGR
jgi:basic membrane protein A